MRFFILSFTTLFSFSTNAQVSCYNGQTLWQWTQGREKMVEASAMCSGGFYSQELNDFKPFPVSVLSSKNMYIDVGFSAEKSERLAKLETEDKLKTACAEKVIDFLKQRHPAKLGRMGVRELRVSMKLTPDERPGTSHMGNFSSREMGLTDKQKIAIQARLNGLNSCSSFPITDKNGVVHISNCAATGIDFSDIDTSEKIKSSKGQKIALAIAAGALAGVIRGGTFGLGNFTERLLFDATMSAIKQMGKGKFPFDPKDWKDTVTNMVRGTVAMATYSTKKFVNGGQSGRGIGTQGPGSALSHGFIQNTLMCGIFNGTNCAVVGGVSAAGYLAAGYAADDNYKIGGIHANTIAEALVGMALGVSLVEKGISDEEKERVKKFMATLKQDAGDLCVNVSDILTAPESKPVVVSEAAK